MRFYVSPRGLVCENHRIFRQWNATDIEDCELIPYTVSNIEDMVDLLRFKPKKLEYVQPGMHSMFWKLRFGEKIIKMHDKWFVFFALFSCREKFSKSCIAWYQLESRTICGHGWFFCHCYYVLYATNIRSFLI